MYTLIAKTLREWNETRTERVKLQHAYVAFAIGLIVLAGLVGLVDYDLGQQMTAIALLIMAVFFVNLIAWTLLQGIVLMRLSNTKIITEPAVTEPKSTMKSVASTPRTKKSTKKSTKTSK